MHIGSICGNHDVSDIEQLERVLETRYDGHLNCFWMSHSDSLHPCLGVFVNGDLAYLLYMREEFDRGFESQGHLSHMLVGEKTTFAIDKIRGDDLDFPNSAVVPWSTALTVAKEFFAADGLPKCVEWLELK